MPEESERAFRGLVEGCLEESGGSLGPALDLLFSKLCEDSKTLLEIVEPMLREKAMAVIRQIRKAPSGIHNSVEKGSRPLARRDDSLGLRAVARANLLDCRLPGLGISMREAKRADLLESGRMLSECSAWFRRIAAELPDGKNVGDSLSEDKLLALARQERIEAEPLRMLMK